MDIVDEYSMEGFSDTFEFDISSSSSSDSSRIDENELYNDVSPRDRFPFSGSQGLLKSLKDPQVLPLSVFEQLLDEDLLRLMSSETNRFAAQASLPSDWSPVQESEMRTFLGLLILMKILKFPRLEDYWNKTPLYYHPLFHTVQMSYRRFSQVLENWTFADAQLASSAGDKFFKVGALMSRLFGNARSLYIPGREMCISRGRIPMSGDSSTQKHSRNGLQILMLRESSGYIWNARLTWGQSESRLLEDLSCDRLLDCGRLFVTEASLSSPSLATGCLNRGTNYIGRLRKGSAREVGLNDVPQNGRIRKDMPEGLKILKFKDEQRKAFLLVNFIHDDGDLFTSKEYFAVRRRIATYDEAHAPFYGRTSLKWYKSVAFLLLHIACINSHIIYKKYYSHPGVHFCDFACSLAEGLLRRGREGGFSLKSSLSTTNTHRLTPIPRKENGDLSRRRCTSCYEDLKKAKCDRMTAASKAKQVNTECLQCSMALCLDCFNQRH